MMQAVKEISTSKTSGRWLTLIIVIIGTFMSVLDTTIINIVMPTITAYFKEGLAKSEWIISGYTLSISVALLCSGWFARKFGYKKVYIIGVVIFTFASFMCSVATNMNYLIAMRLLQGIGSGIIIPLSMSIIAHSFMGKQRGLAIGLLIMTIGIAVSLGPFLGGYFVKIDRWDWVFKVNVPTGILLLAIIPFIMKNYKDSSVTKFDYIGVALLLVWAPLSLYLLSANFNWLLLLVLIISFGLFVLRMIYASDALIDIQIFKNRDFILAIILMTCFGTVLLGSNYILSQYLLHSQHYSAYMSGMMFIPVGIIQGSMAPIIGAMTHKYGNRLFILLGLCVILVYLYLSSMLTMDSPHWHILLTLYLRGFGIGFSLTAIINLSFDGAKPTEIDSVSGVINMVKQLSGSFSIAVATLIIVNNTTPTSATSSKDYALANDQSFMILFGIIVVAIIALLLMKKRTKHSALVNK